MTGTTMLDQGIDPADGNLDTNHDLSIAGLCRALPPIGLYRFELTAQDPIVLGDYAGSAFRGLFGHGLKRTVCVTRLPICDGCLLQANCAYPLLFETPAGAVGESRARFVNAAHPFVLRTPWDHRRELRAGDGFDLGMLLFGRANSLLAYVIHALGVAGKRGIGRRQGRFELREVMQSVPGSDREQPVYMAGERLAIPADLPSPAASRCPDAPLMELLTPLRLRRGGRLVGPHDLDARQLLTALVRRAESLARYFGRPVAALADQELAGMAAGLRIDRATLRWADWTRYSSRQRTHMQMGGLLGDLVLGGEGLARVWPLLELGQWLHLGKGTSMGLGHYRLRCAVSLPDRTAAGAR